MKTPTRKVPDADGGELVGSRVISTGPCKLLQLVVFNSAASIRYIFAYELDEAPPGDDEETPDIPPIAVGAGQTAMVDFGANGMDWDKLVVVVSASPSEMEAAADCSITGVLHG